MRHIPDSSTSWYVVPNSDGLTGAEVWGDQTNDAASWGVKFDTITHD